MKVFTFIAGAFSQNVGNLLSKLKLVTDNLSIYAAANWEATESLSLMYPQALKLFIVTYKLYHETKP